MSSPGLVLALETSTPYGSVAVGRGGEVLSEASVLVGTGHSAHLVPLVEEVLGRVGAGPTDLTAVLVGAGPGSFTGVRIGAATARGIARSLRMPMRAYSTLLVLAAGCAAADRPVVALLDARNRDVFSAAYRFRGEVETLAAPRAAPLDEVVAALMGGEPPLLVGDGALRHAEELRERLPGAILAPDHLTYPRAATLLWLDRAAPAYGEAGLDPAWEPEYLRAPGAERIAAARAERVHG
jgi:tRNA threonylcarbamoyladenosine biosynthesis protein TsaB